MSAVAAKGRIRVQDVPLEQEATRAKAKVEVKVCSRCLRTST